MSRWIVAFGCALTLALATPLGEEAEASGFSRKKCIAPAMRTAQATWVCNASEKCCYDRLLRKGTCTARCF